jgi:hypothetical protein
MVKLLDSDECEWSKIPSDTRFPGFFSSMSDHALATSAVGVAIAVELYNKGVDLAGEYDGEMAELLKTRRGVIEVVRTLCLLHDSGKPSTKHTENTKKAVEEILSKIGFGKLATDLAESASRHHYDKDSERPPRTKVEWVVAYADKVAVQDRTFAGKILGVAVQPLRWLGDHVDASNKQKIYQLADFIERFGNDTKIDIGKVPDEIKKILPLDYKFFKETLDSELLNVRERLSEDIKLALILFEGAGIQGYVRKSSSARHLVGRSSLVEVATRLAAKSLEDMLAPESIIYVTSGSVFAIVPPSELHQVVDTLNKGFEDVVKGGISLKCCKSAEDVSFSLFELKTGPKFTWANWKEESKFSRIERRNFGEFYTILNNTISVLDHKVGGSLMIPAGKICSICFEEKALPENDLGILDVIKRLPEDEREGYKAGAVCLNVDQHRMKLKEKLAGSFEIEFKGEEADVTLRGKVAPEDVKNSPIFMITEAMSNILRDKLNAEHKDLIGEFSGRSIVFENAKSWNFLGLESEYALEGKGVPEKEEMVPGVSDVAFIGGDGDNFGLIKSAMNNLTLYRKVSKIFKEVMQDSVAKALSEVIIYQLRLYSQSYRPDKKLEPPAKLYLPFDMVYFGGDDFLLVLDAGFVFIFLKAFRDAILDRLGSRKQNYEKRDGENLSVFSLGVSLGVVVAPNRAPIHGTLSALSILESKAKKLSKHRQKVENNKPVFGGEISVALERFTTIPTKEFVEENYKAKDFGGTTKICSTSWPLLGADIFSDSPKDGQPLPLINLTKKLLEEHEIRSNNVAEFARIETPSEEEIKLQIRFKAARMDEKRPEREGYRLLANNLTVKEDDCIKFRHGDIANAMRIVKESPLLLPSGGG